MKLDARRLPAFLQNPGDACCVLLYGDDTGLIRERAEQLARAVVPDRDDPFRVSWLDRGDQERLAEESSARALTGGRRVVRVRDAGDTLLPHLKLALASPMEALLVLEAPDLVSRSKLRAFVEAMDNGAAIGCYPDEGRSLEQVIRGRLEQHKISIEPDAMHYLLRHLGADRALTQSELEKLALYAGPNGKVDLDAAQACIGDVAARSVDDALYAATGGDVDRCDHALSVALAEGTTPVGLLRQAQGHFQRLHRARLAMEQGNSAEDAARAVRPPLFFRLTPLFVKALRLWPAAALFRAAQTAAVAEQDCKRTGAPDQLICRQFLLSIAQRADASARR